MERALLDIDMATLDDLAKKFKARETRKPGAALPPYVTVDQCRKRAVAAQTAIDNDSQFYARALKFESPAWRNLDIVLRAAVEDGGLDKLRDKLVTAWDYLADPDLHSHASITRTISHSNLAMILWELSILSDSPYRPAGFTNPAGYYSRSMATHNIEQARKWYARDTSVEQASVSAAHDYIGQLAELRQAETDFWREMEALSGQRQKFKPGVADTLDTRDELIAA